MKAPQKNKKRKSEIELIGLIIVIAVIVCKFITAVPEEDSIEFLPPDDVQDSFSYVHFIDADQGDCTLIETSDGKFGLIDASTGEAENKVLHYLEKEGVQELEFILFTHPHEDHIGCGDEILDTYKVKTVYMNDKTETTSCYEQLLDSIKDSKKRYGTKVIKPSEGDSFSLGDIEFFVLSDGSEYSDLNNSSICLKFEFGNSSFIITGDAEKIVEQDILKSGHDVEADVYKCAHHGSSTSNSDAFL